MEHFAGGQVEESSTAALRFGSGAAPDLEASASLDIPGRFNATCSPDGVALASQWRRAQGGWLQAHVAEESTKRQRRAERPLFPLVHVASPASFSADRRSASVLVGTAREVRGPSTTRQIRTSRCRLARCLRCAAAIVRVPS
jgi:hypothetical protein